MSTSTTPTAWPEQYALHNQPDAVLTVTKRWGEYNEVHHRTTNYVEYDIEFSGGKPATRGCHSTDGNWELSKSNHIELPDGIRLMLEESDWCAVDRDFINLAESPAGFAKNPMDAVGMLQSRVADGRRARGIIDDLSTSCQSLLDIIHDDLTHARQNDHAEAIDAARAAIAKAKGGAA